MARSRRLHFPSVPASCGQSWSAGDALKFSLSVMSCRASRLTESLAKRFSTLFAHFCRRRCWGILREKRLMLELLGLLGQGSLKEKTPFFMLFSCLFILFSSCSFYFEPFFLSSFTLISVIFKRFACGEYSTMTTLGMIRWISIKFRDHSLNT